MSTIQTINSPMDLFEGHEGDSDDLEEKRHPPSSVFGWPGFNEAIMGFMRGNGP
jgi:hypothetical protein